MQRHGVFPRAGRCLAGFGLAAILVVILAACESAPAPPAPEAVAAPDTQPKAESAAAAAPAAVIETGASGAGVAMLPPAPLEPPAPPEPVIDDDPQQLYGLDSRALGELLGEPSLVRAEAPAEIWQYRGQTCVFDVFLYDQDGGQSDSPRVSYIEARDDAAERIDTRACLNELLRARLGLPLG